jgi:hypothetical protein
MYSFLLAGLMYKKLPKNYFFAEGRELFIHQPGSKKAEDTELFC